MARIPIGFQSSLVENIAMLWLQKNPSLRRRSILTSASDACKAAPILLFWATNGLYELLEVGLEFPFILIGKSSMAFLTGQSWRVLEFSYTAGGAAQGFRRCFTDGLHQNLVKSVALQALNFKLFPLPSHNF